LQIAQLPEQKTQSRNLLLVLALFAGIGALLYYLVWDIRPYPVPAFVDDYLYVRSAWFVKNLQWLGPFDAFTLVKRPFFAVLLAVTSVLHLPFIQFQIFFYVGSVAFFTYCLLGLGMPRWIAPQLLGVLAFVPTLYDANGSRVLRETSTVALEFIILGLALRMLNLEPGRQLRDVLKGRKLLGLGLLYLLAAFHWGMREEGILLTAVLAPLLCLIAVRCIPGSLVKRLSYGLLLNVGLVLAMVSSYVAIASTNFVVYGVFLVNDLSEGTFPKAVGALKSILEGPRPELLLEPSETDKLRELSPTFRPIGDVLDIAQMHDPDMDYSHEMFFLRVSALRGTEIGTSAPRTQQYFQDLATDVGRLCAEGKLTCDANPRASMIPQLSRQQWELLPGLLRELGQNVIRTENSGFDFKSQFAHDMEAPEPVIVRHFIEISRQQPFGLNGQQVEFTLPGPLGVILKQQQHRRWMGDLYNRWSPRLYGLAAASFLIFGTAAALGKDRRRWIVVLAVLGFQVVLRISAFSYIGAAFDGTVPSRLMTSAYPAALAFAVLVPNLTLALIIERLRGWRNQRFRAKA